MCLPYFNLLLNHFYGSDLNNSRRYIVALSTIILLAAVTFILIIKGNMHNDGDAPGESEGYDSVAERIVETTVFQVEEGWGYDIYIDGERYIHQPTIPVIQGFKAFENETDAKKVAELVAGKIRMNIIPPAISYEELDSLGIIK
jgi:hypothetical protein